jgi:hypothetical protein
MPPRRTQKDKVANAARHRRQKERIDVSIIMVQFNLPVNPGN